MKEIHQVIEEIELKISKIRAKAVAYKEDNEALKAELQLVNQKLEEREQEARDFQEKYNHLLHQQIQQPVEEREENDSRNVEIDALVREIEDCISKLKE